MTLEPVTSPKNLLNKVKITKELLNSLSSGTQMFVCTKLQLQVEVCQWLCLNFTSARLILTARHCFRLQAKHCLNSKQSYHEKYELCKRPTLVQK